jgi:hypothetical protein
MQPKLLSPISSTKCVVQLHRGELGYETSEFAALISALMYP